MKVLVATDGSDPAQRASQWLRDLIHDRDAEVRILTVLSYDMYPYALVAGEHLSSEHEMEEAVRARIDHVTKSSVGTLRDAGCAVEVTHRFGNPGGEIIAEIEDWQPDLVVVGRRGVRGLERLLGSVSEHVIHQAKVPILVVP